MKSAIQVKKPRSSRSGFYNKKKPNEIVRQHTDSHQSSCEQCSKGFVIILQLQEQITEKYEAKQASLRMIYHLQSIFILRNECIDRGLPSDGTYDELVLRLEENDTQKIKPIEFELMRVSDMRTECKKRKIPSSGNRDDLLPRLHEYEEDLKQYRPKYKLRTLNEAERMELDLLEEQLHDIELRKQDFVQYRSHLARHQSENDYAKLELENLEDDEAIVTCDYKMKLLACFFRENQKKWFGKRGTTVLGFMICTNSKIEANREKGIKDLVSFYFYHHIIFLFIQTFI